MPVSLKNLEAELNRLLQPEQFKDYCPNGLQVEGRAQVSKIVTGVTACQALIDAAIEERADLILVHHGYFWKGEDQAISGIKKTRIQSLLANEISLCAYHLPLDAHAEFGNNSQLAKLLGISVTGVLAQANEPALVMTGTLAQPVSVQEFQQLLASKLNRQPVVVQGGGDRIMTLAWCTGAAQGYIPLAVAAGVDAYISGEISEATVHIARESGVHFFSAGHHATERYGVQALGEYLAEKYAIEHRFIDIDNPA
jgi:dinuclear metal center YbgI/SA1388 family protein